jgi:AraC-like DNA-binding protein
MRPGPTIRISALTGYIGLAKAAGLDPARLAKQAGIKPSVLQSPEAVVPARSAYRLLELSATQSGIADFGLRLARQRGLSHLGTLGLMVRDEPNLRSALLRIMSGIRMHSTCTLLTMQEGAEVSILTMTLLSDGESVIRQGTETALGQLFQDLVVLAGPTWRPVGVQFIHATISNSKSHRAMFGCPVAFSTERNAIVVRTADLDLPVIGADAGFRVHSEMRGSNYMSVGGPISAERTRQVIASMLQQGVCTSRAVAKSIGVDRRTLHRHLSEAGTDFSRLLVSVRTEMAEQYLQARELTLTDISILLGFNSLSSFSRWFSARYGCTPTKWRHAATRTRDGGLLLAR